jgi:hypothetical protein
MNLKQLWSIIRGHQTNFRCMNASMTYYPNGDPVASMNIVYLWNKHTQDTKVKTLSVDQLKSMWDCWDGITPVDGIWGETIHAELNRRGEGKYCAV